MSRNEIFLVVIFLMVLFLPSVSADSNNITITTPIYDPLNDPISSDFQTVVQVSDNNVRQVQAKILNAGLWQDLEQTDASNWQGTINISSIQNGDYQLTARYIRNGDSFYSYVQNTTKISIKKPVAPTPTPTPTPQPAATTPKFNVTGYSTTANASTVFYIRVTDAANHTGIDGALVQLYEGNVVKSIPGLTTNGGRIYFFTPATSGNYLLSITKDGYEDWGDVITVTGNPTTTPTPTAYGNLTITFSDVNGNPLSGVSTADSSNKSDSTGKITIIEPINQALNISFSLTGYNTSYLPITLASSQTSASVMMHKINGDLKQMLVTGYSKAVAGRGVFVFTTDKLTGQKLDNVSIFIMDGNTVKSSPGVTVNGRVFVTMPSDATNQYLRHHEVLTPPIFVIWSKIC